MRKALIAGFFDHVEVAVREEFGAAVDRGDVVIVGLGRSDPRHGLNMELFKKAVGQVTIDGCTDVLVVLGNSVSWIEDSVLAVLGPYGERFQIKLEVLRDLRDAAAVVNHLRDFGIVVESSDSDTELLRRRLAGQRVYAVRCSRNASFERTLARLGFAFDADQLVEEVSEPARNSNLIQSLTSKAEHFDWLLYAWAGLRTLSADAKRKFRAGCCEADSPMKVGTMFKRRLLKDD